jgi:hypothetical protein
MRKSSILGSIFVLACGGSVQQTPDAGNGNNNDAAPQPEASPVVDAGPDVDNGAPSTTYPAFSIDAPQVVNAGAGPVLATPRVVPVYFSNDDTSFTSQITTFLTKLPTSTYWGPQVSEYGVGAISSTQPVQLASTEPAPTTIDDSAIQTWLQGKLQNNDPLWPAPDANTVYTIFYPSTTTITLGTQGGSSCSSFGGYHNNITINSTTNVAYAVVPRCDNFGGLTGIDAVTAPTTHEIIEAATDPYPQTQQAFGQVDDNHILWEYVLGGGEVGDMCAQFQTSFYKPTDLGFEVQRTWSDSAAVAGHDPCLPSDGTPYFNSMPVLPDMVSLGGQVNTKGIHIPVGGTATIEVDLFSDAPTQGPWTLKASDAAQLQGGTPTLQFAWDRTTGVNGEKLHLTITVTAASQYGAAGFILRSTLGSRHNSWFGLVGN